MSKRFHGEHGYRSIDALQHMAQSANWRERAAGLFALGAPVEFDAVEVHGMDRVWLADAILSVTREELLEYYDEALRRHQACLKSGGDFTAQNIRDAQPHLYGQEPK